MRVKQVLEGDGFLELRRGDASPPRPEPRIDVGVLTVLVIDPMVAE
jgi:hypothetical protein